MPLCTVVIDFQNVLYAQNAAAVTKEKASQSTILQQLQWRPSQYFEPLKIQKAALAINDGNIAELKRLHDAGIDWNHRGSDGVTLLLWAFLAEKLDCFTLLLDWNADPNTLVEFSSPIEIGGGSRHIVAGQSTTFIAAMTPGKRSFLEACVHRGGSVSFIEEQSGDTIFSVLCRRKGLRDTGRFVTESLLLSKGANINHRSKDGRTPLLISYAVFDWMRVIDLLMNGADARCYDSTDRQLVHLVAETDLRQSILNMGDPEVLTAWNSSPEKKDFDRIVALLEERGFSLDEAKADVSRRNEMVDGVPFMKWRRMQREDKDACSETPAKAAADSGKTDKKTDQ